MTAAEFAAQNPVLELNQLAVVTEVVDNVSVAARDAKLGDGVTRYNSLAPWPPGIDGDVQGPASSTDNAAVRFDSTTGKVVQNSGIILDDNANVIANNIAPGFTTTATAAGTTPLTVASDGVQAFTGVTTQTVTLPVVTTLPQTGFTYKILNNSTGAVTVNSSGGNAVQVMAANTVAVFTCILLTGTDAASWDVEYNVAAPGDFVGPGSSTDNAVVRFDLTTGKLGQNSGVVISDANAITAGDGTSALPAYSFVSDPNTGIISSSANSIGFVTDGTERWVINASGALNPISNNTYDIGNGSVNPRDITAARNIIASNLAPGLVSTATAAGTTTLDVTSKGTQVFTGATTQTVVLPVVTTLPQIGFQYLIINNSSGALTVNSSGANLVQTIAANSRALVTCVLLTGTTAASWSSTYVAASSGITNSAGANVIPKSDGTNLVASRFGDTGSGNATLSTGLTTTQGTLTTTVTPYINHTATWNDGATIHQGILSNVTNTASSAASKLIDLQVGGVTQFNVTRAGAGTFAGGVSVSGPITAAVGAGTSYVALGAQSANPAASATSARVFADAGGGFSFRNATAGTNGNVATFTDVMTADRVFTLPDAAGTVILTTTGTGFSSGVQSSSPTAGIGYATGAGGAVTQITSRTTGVTLNKITGAITLVSAAGSATPASFTVTNSAVAATDVIIVNQKSGTDLYEIHVTAVAAGSFQITSNTTGGTTTETPVFNFAVIKGVAA